MDQTGLGCLSFPLFELPGILSYAFGGGNFFCGGCFCSRSCSWSQHDESELESSDSSNALGLVYMQQILLFFLPRPSLSTTSSSQRIRLSSSDAAGGRGLVSSAMSRSVRDPSLGTLDCPRERWTPLRLLLAVREAVVEDMVQVGPLHSVRSTQGEALPLNYVFHYIVEGLRRAQSVML